MTTTPTTRVASAVEPAPDVITALSADDATPRTSATSSVGAQLAAACGQLAAGAGNLVFALICARLLEPRAFARLAAFLALYVLMHVVAGSVSPGAAIDPPAARRAAPALWASGAVVGVVLVTLSAPLGAFLGIGTGLVIALGLAAPFAGALAAHRGRLYGTDGIAQVVASIAAEPAVRLTAGVALAAWAGHVGAAIGVAMAGWTAMAVASRRRARARRWRSFSLAVDDAATVEPRDRPVGTREAVVSFLLLAVLMNQDLLLANRLLPGREAAHFAVLSTLGGVAAFATTTVPLVLLGQRARPHALRTAIWLATALGLGAVIVVIVANRTVIGLAFGERYAAVAARAVPYVLAMAILGVGRVLAAHLCATGLGVYVMRVAAAAVAFQLALIVLVADDALDVARVTLATTASLTTVLAGAELVRRRVWRAVAVAARRRAGAARVWLGAVRHSRTARIVAALTLLALLIRSIVLRSLWLDEAIAVAQAHLPFGSMLSALRQGDVHPPLHASVLWVTVRTIGSGEIAVRLPSIIAGTLVIPSVYLLARELYDRRTALIAAALSTVAPFLVWYAQEARMYAIFTLLSVLAALGQARALRRGRMADWALYGLSTALLVWTQYFAILQVVAQQAIFAVALWNRRRRRHDAVRTAAGWLGATALVVLALVPLAPFLGDQLHAYAGRSAGVQDLPAQAGHGATGTGPGLSIYAALANLVWAVWGYHSDATMAQVVALWPLGMLFLLYLLGRGWSRDTASLVAIAVVPMAALYALGVAKRNLFEIRYLAGIAPALIVLSSRVVAVGFRARRSRIAAAGVLSLTLVAGLIDQQVNGANPRLYDFRGALAQVESIARDGDRVLYAPAYLEPIVSYYSPQLDARRLGKTVPRDTDRVILLASFIDQKPIAAQAGWALSQLGEHYRLERRIDRPRVRVWVFS